MISKNKRIRNSHSTGLLILLFIICISGGICLFIFTKISQGTHESFGMPSADLTQYQQLIIPIQLFINRNDLTTPIEQTGKEVKFTINSGESASYVAYKLQEAGLIKNAETFRIYLIYTGLDTHIQAGDYSLNTGATAIQIAQDLKDATSKEVNFRILPGWRIEEIAASLPTSGLLISPDDFIKATHLIRSDSLLNDPSTDIASLEGFLFPDTYQFPRDTSLDQFISIIEQNFNLKVTDEIREGFTQQGLTLLQGVILASIVQKEAMVEDEQPIIASVFLNRLRMGMKLESDPTVQFALGYNNKQITWWTNPLSLDDLRIDSPYNTYQNYGLPPGPISNPGITALRAVAFPDQTPYYYFRAKCDDSGRHNFAVTFQEQLQNACP